jgi:hypothetical protein
LRALPRCSSGLNEDSFPEAFTLAGAHSRQQQAKQRLKTRAASPKLTRPNARPPTLRARAAYKVNWGTIAAAASAASEAAAAQFKAAAAEAEEREYGADYSDIFLDKALVWRRRRPGEEEVAPVLPGLADAESTSEAAPADGDVKPMTPPNFLDVGIASNDLWRGFQGLNTQTEVGAGVRAAGAAGGALEVVFSVGVGVGGDVQWQSSPRQAPQGRWPLRRNRRNRPPPRKPLPNAAPRKRQQLSPTDAAIAAGPTRVLNAVSGKAAFYALNSIGNSTSDVIGLVTFPKLFESLMNSTTPPDGFTAANLLFSSPSAFYDKITGRYFLATGFNYQKIANNTPVIYPTSGNTLIMLAGSDVGGTDPALSDWGIAGIYLNVCGDDKYDRLDTLQVGWRV